MPIQVFVIQPKGTEKMLALEARAIHGMVHRLWCNCIVINPYDAHYRRGYELARVDDASIKPHIYQQLAMQRSEACVVIPFPASVHAEGVPLSDKSRVDRVILDCVLWFHGRGKSVFIAPPDFSALAKMQVQLFTSPKSLRVLNDRQATRLIAAYGSNMSQGTEHGTLARSP